MSFSDSVGKFIEKQELFVTDDKLLLAVSGGIDSMVMLDVLRVMGYKVEVAHVNYKLRGEDADLDEHLVMTYCITHEIPCHIHRVTPAEQLSLQKGNLQSEARKIRYSHFDDICRQYGLDYICTAHHIEDKVETFFLNLMRGSGLKGLSSISSIHDKIRRPLIQVSRQDIISYALSHEVSHRQDQSNLTDKYNRNFLRHQVIPTLKERWPEATDQINRSTGHIQDSEALLSHLITQNSDTWSKLNGNRIIIGPITTIRQTPGGHTLLHYLMKPYHVSSDALDKVLDSDMTSGSTLESPTHEVVMDRDQIIIVKKLSAPHPVELTISSPGIYPLDNTTRLIVTNVKEYVRTEDPLTEYVSLDETGFPMKMRIWQHGDTIKPIGMQGQSKLVSDILSNAKMDMLSKQDQLVLVDKFDDILWLVGHRINEKCKITSTTSQILKLQIQRHS